jgi:transposase
MIQLAWRFLIHQKDSALARWYEASITVGKKRKPMIDENKASARPAMHECVELLIALWRFVTTGDVPQGVVLRPA